MSSVKKNILLLYILQGANYLVPLITLPYLTRTLGVSTFGMMGIAVGVIGVLTLVTDWGFSLTATQEVARHSDTPEHLHRLFWDTFWARMWLGAVAFVGLFVVVLVMPSIRQLGLILLAASVQVFSSMMAVGWFLQGVQRMGIFVWTFLFGRVLTIPLIFMLVHGPQDVALAMLIPGVCGLLSCYISFREVNRHVPLLPMRFNTVGIWEQIRSGAKIFISTAAINLYTQSNILILSAFSPSAQVGLYHGSSRILGAVQSLIGPAGTAVFPHINHLMVRDKQAAKTAMIRMLIIQGGFTFLLSFLMFVLAPWGVPFALGKDFATAVPVVQWLSPLPFLIGLSNVFGINVMLPLGMKTEFTVIVIASAVINFLGMVCFCPFYGAIGAAMSLNVAETFVTGAMAFVLYRRKNWKSEENNKSVTKKRERNKS